MNGEVLVLPFNSRDLGESRHARASKIRRRLERGRENQTQICARRVSLYCSGWILSASFMTSSSLRRCTKVQTSDRSRNPTSLLQIEDTMKHSHQALGSGCGKAMASVADLRTL